MATLEELIGPGYENLSNEELEQMIMTGRVAREGEAEGAKAKKGGGRKAAGPKKNAIPTFDLDLDDVEVPEMDLEL